MAGARPLALFAPLALLSLGALESPPPWGLLWIVVPLVGGAGYLTNRSGRPFGWLAPLAVAVWLVALGVSGELYAWALLGCVASVVLFGLVTPPAGVSVGGQTLWALLPLLALTAVFPASGLYPGAVHSAVTAIQTSSEQAYARYQELGLSGGALEALATQLDRSSKLLVAAVRSFLPTVLFVWCAVLVSLTILLAVRVRETVGRPFPYRAPFAWFAMPEEAVWLLVLGLAGVAARQEPLASAGRNLAVCLAIGYALQGLAILRFAVAKRGWRAGMYWVLLFFVLIFAPPVLAIGATILGLADVWLDLRRRWLESHAPERGA